MTLGFLMDSPLGMTPETETTAYLMWAASCRGHRLFVFDSTDLLGDGPLLKSRGHLIEPLQVDSVSSFWKEVTRVVGHQTATELALDELDLLCYRKNPPLDRRAVKLLLERKVKPPAVNDLKGLLKAGDKRYLLEFPELIPCSRIVYNHHDLCRLVEDFQGEVVKKPLDGFGGKGVVKGGVRDMVERFKQGPYPFLVQQFLPQVWSGDVRVLMLDGRVLGAMRRVPPPGSFRANVSAGGSVFRHELRAAERDICQAVSGRLRQEGLYLVGLDLIGDRLIEINCVSPGGIPRINRLNGCALQEQVLDFLEQKI